MRIRLAAMLAGAFIVGAAVGWYFHKPEPEFVIDHHAGDLDLRQMMNEGRFHGFFRCPKPYTLKVEPDLSDPESGDTSEVITTCK